MKSKIFTDAELKAMEERQAGSKKDPTGIYSGRVKPKLKEILEWFKRKVELKKLIGMVFLLSLLLLAAGCESTGSHFPHVCEAPYTYNLSCVEARACIAGDFSNPILKQIVGSEYCAK